VARYASNEVSTMHSTSAGTARASLSPRVCRNGRARRGLFKRKQVKKFKKACFVFFPHWSETQESVPIGLPVLNQKKAGTTMEATRGRCRAASDGTMKRTRVPANLGAGSAQTTARTRAHSRRAWYLSRPSHFAPSACLAAASEAFAPRVDARFRVPTIFPSGPQRVQSENLKATRACPSRCPPRPCRRTSRATRSWRA
jgi:hypothetical protein